MQKWISRKLFVALVSVIAISWGIFKGDPEAEVELMTQGETIATAAVTVVSSVYIIIQGLIDKKDK